MTAMRTRWPDERVDDLKEAVDGVKVAVERLQQSMIVAVIAICSMMFAGFSAMVVLYATHF